MIMVLLILPDFRSFSYFLSERIFTPFFLFLYHIPILVSLNQLTILDFISFHKSFPIPFQSCTLVLMKSIMEIAPMKRIKIVVKMVSIIVVFCLFLFSNTKIIHFFGFSKFFYKNLSISFFVGRHRQLSDDFRISLLILHPI